MKLLKNRNNIGIIVFTPKLLPMSPKITRMIVIAMAWLMALSLVYLFILKLRLLKSLFH